MELQYPFLFTPMKTVRAICVKIFLPEPIHVSSLNEYDCVLAFPTEFELCKIAMDLQQIMQWFGYDVVITCKVVAQDRLNEIEQDREEPNQSPSLDVTGKNFETPTASAQQIKKGRKGYPKHCQSTGGPWEPTSRMIGGYCVQKY